MVGFEENSGDDLHWDDEHEEPNLTNMDDATAQLIDRVQKIEEWVNENPQHEEVREWSRDILVAALYIENEYTYKSDALTQAELTTSNFLVNANPRLLLQAQHRAWPLASRETKRSKSRVSLAGSRKSRTKALR